MYLQNNFNHQIYQYYSFYLYRSKSIVPQSFVIYGNVLVHINDACYLKSLTKFPLKLYLKACPCIYGTIFSLQVKALLFLAIYGNVLVSMLRQVGRCKRYQVFIHLQGLGISQLADHLVNEINQGLCYVNEINQDPCYVNITLSPRFVDFHKGYLVGNTILNLF